MAILLSHSIARDNLGAEMMTKFLINSTVCVGSDPCLSMTNRDNGLSVVAR